MLKSPEIHSDIQQTKLTLQIGKTSEFIKSDVACTQSLKFYALML